MKTFPVIKRINLLFKDIDFMKKYKVKCDILINKIGWHLFSSESEREKIISKYLLMLNTLQVGDLRRELTGKNNTLFS